MTSVMSTSLKVVSMAAVFCASFRRRAMVWRSLVRRTRSSREASSGAAGARIGARSRRGAAARERAAGAGGGAGGLASASITSPFSTWPRLPLPATPARSMPASLAIFAAEGAGGMAGRACGRRRSPWRERLAALGGAVGASPGAGLAAAAAPRRQRAEQRADRDGRARSAPISRQHAGGGRVDLERHLLRLQFHQRLVRLDGFAALLEPFADGRLGDRFAERRNANFSGHVILRRGAAPFCLFLRGNGGDRRQRLDRRDLGSTASDNSRTRILVRTESTGSWACQSSSIFSEGALAIITP